MSRTRPAPIVVDDLAAPRLPWWFRAARAAARPTRDLVRLDPDSLITAARRTASLHDLGDERFLEPLTVLTRALDTECGLTDLGRLMARQLLVQLLVTRLRLVDVLLHYPEIRSAEVTAPIVILGLPRTGTTHLHNCLAADPALRFLPYWEALEPISATPVLPGQRDRRIARAAAAIAVLNRAMPLFPAMHEITAEGPHEEIQLLAVELSTMLFEASYDVPGYRDWYLRTDQTHAYAGLRTLLQFLQWERGGVRWVLKSPQHLEQMGPLLSTFPDAVLVQTHRDPVSVTASMATMAAYARRLQHRVVDPLRVGPYWADRIERMLRAAVRDRDTVPGAERTLDLHFGQFMAGEDATIAAVYAAADQPYDAAARLAIDAHRAAHPRGRYGRLAYRLGDLGLERAELRERFRFYEERFDVAEELT